MMRFATLSLAACSTAAAFSAAPSTQQQHASVASPSMLSMAALSPDGEESSNDSSRKNNDIVMSQAIPFLPVSKVLQENADMAGNVGFDPLNLASSTEQLWQYREAEMKHARLAMLAAVGWPASELWDRAVASQWDMEPMLDASGRAPSLLNGGLGRVSPIWWGFCIGLCAAIDMYGVAKARRGDTDYRPGMLGFDPLTLYPADKKGQANVELAEIKHGRLAMVTVVSYSMEEWLTDMSLVDETPMLFTPWSETLQQIEMMAFE